MSSTLAIERSLVDTLRYNYPQISSVRPNAKRRDSKLDKELHYQVRVHWQDHGNYIFDITNTMLIADLKSMVQSKTNIPTIRQRLLFEGRVLEASRTFHESGFDDSMLRPSALWTQIELEHLRGICLLDSDVDFWVNVSGSVPEEMLLIHAKSSTLLRDLGALLFEQYSKLLPGRRQLVREGRVLYDSQPEGGGSASPCVTLGELGVEQGRVLNLHMVL